MDPEALPLRSTGIAPNGVSPTGVLAKTGVTDDEAHQSTLKAVQDALHEGLEALFMNFNAFKRPEGVARTTALYDLQVQIDGNQKAYDVLAPTVEIVDAALAKIDMKYKQ